MPQVRTAEDFLKELEDRNLSVAQWCREHRASTNTVWAIAAGRVLGRSGEARRVMKLMGLEVPSFRRDHPNKVRATEKTARVSA